MSGEDNNAEMSGARSAVEETKKLSEDLGLGSRAGRRDQDRISRHDRRRGRIGYARTREHQERSPPVRAVLSIAKFLCVVAATKQDDAASGPSPFIPANARSKQTDVVRRGLLDCSRQRTGKHSC
jgi:hypothetical protein